MWPLSIAAIFVLSRSAVENRKSQEDLKETQQVHGKATADIFERVIEMPRNTYTVLYVLVLVAVVVSVDVLFFKNRFWARLMVNIGIVLVFVAFYLRFLKNP